MGRRAWLGRGARPPADSGVAGAAEGCGTGEVPGPGGELRAGAGVAGGGTRLGRVTVGTRAAGGREIGRSRERLCPPRKVPEIGSGKGLPSLVPGSRSAPSPAPRDWGCRLELGLAGRFLLHRESQIRPSGWRSGGNFLLHRPEVRTSGIFCDPNILFAFYCF